MEKHVTIYQWTVVYAYDVNGHRRGEIYSRHTRYELARKAARRSGIDSFLEIKYIPDYFME